MKQQRKKIKWTQHTYTPPLAPIRTHDPKSIDCFEDERQKSAVLGALKPGRLFSTVENLYLETYFYWERPPVIPHPILIPCLHPQNAQIEFPVCSIVMYLNEARVDELCLRNRRTFRVPRHVFICNGMPYIIDRLSSVFPL